MTDESYRSALPDEILERIAAELPDSCATIQACLNTAADLMERATSGGGGLRLAESAAYNLREALVAAVAGGDAAQGGLPAVREAWRRYQIERQAGTEEGTARAALDEVLARVAEDQDRSSFRARQLLHYLRTKSGVDPLPDDLDPVGQYSRLVSEANSALHSDCSLSEVSGLFDRTVAWFVRIFTPPDSQVQALGDLAERPYDNTDQLDELRRLATNPHHLRMFYTRLLDPAWLGPLYEADLIGLPSPGQPWPVSGLLGGLGATAPDDVAGLLSRLLNDTKKLPKNERSAVRFDLLRAASQLGAAGHTVAAEVIKLDRDNRSVRGIGVIIASGADPGAPIVTEVADAVLDRDSRGSADWEITTILERLETGLAADNLEQRVRLLAAKVGRLASRPYAKYLVDIATLRTAVDGTHDAVLVLAHHLVRLIAKARELGADTSELLAWTKGIPGDVGERVICQVLANAPDVPLQQKIDHIATRLSSSTATGDDRDLIDDVLSVHPQRHQLTAWTDALAVPTEAPALAADDPLPDDWARAWRWSAVLPADTLALWQEQIRHVSARHGEPSPHALNTRLERYRVSTERSPISADDLSALSVAEAAKRVSEWRPDAGGTWDLVSARALARAMEVVVGKDLAGWTAAPTTVVTRLREPVYVLHYFRALAEHAAELSERASAIFDAARTARTARWEPAALGDDDYDFEPGWDGVIDATVDLIREFAKHNGNLTHDLDEAWQWVVELTRTALPQGERDDAVNEGDLLTAAINRPWGRGLQAAIALAGWEARHGGIVRPPFTDLLDRVLQTGGVVGMQLRAILALHRPQLEALVSAWLDRNADALFGDDPRGQATLDLTIQWAPTTPWLLRTLRNRLFDAARRGADRAMQHILVATIHSEEAGYSIAEVIGELSGDVPALRGAAEDMPLLVQDADPGSGPLAVAIEFWTSLLEADRQVVPTDVLHALGRWAFVTGIEDTQCLGLMGQTLHLTNGSIDYRIEVADRCRSDHPSRQHLALLEQLLGLGELWERDYIERIAVDALQAAAQQPVAAEFWRLRTRLIELGRHDASEVIPPESD